MGLINRIQGLQIEKISTSGYFPEDLGSTKFLNHYHKFYFYFNITDLDVSYHLLLNNVITLETKIINPLSRKVFGTLKDNCKSIENQLQKFKHRNKRGLADILGSAIKFITGNPDNNDLIEINKNLDSLYKNQNNIIKQINRYTTFANHITARYSKDLQIIRNDLNSSLSAIVDVNNLLYNLLVVEYYNFISLKLLNALRSIERTVSLAFSEITNLEIISDSELHEIVNHLKLIYKRTELLELDTLHAFKILEFSKFQIVSTKDIITCILKIPILDSSPFQYTRIYPIPDKQNNVLIPPGKYHLQGTRREIWTDEKCKVIENQIVCFEKPRISECSFTDFKNCTIAMANNNYKLFTQLQNGKILVSCKIRFHLAEECKNNVYNYEIIDNVLVSSKDNCKIIIGDDVFVNTFSNFTFENSLVISNINPHKTNLGIQLQQKHLDDLKDLKEDLKILSNNDFSLDPILHVTHFSLTLSIIVISCISILLLYVFRNRLKDFIYNQKLKESYESRPTPTPQIHEGVLS